MVYHTYGGLTFVKTILFVFGTTEYRNHRRMQNVKLIFTIAAKLHYLPVPRVKRRHFVEQVLCGR